MTEYWADTVRADTTKHRADTVDDLGGRWGVRPLSGIRPPADPKGPPFALFSDIHFWLTDLKIFLMAPIYTNFEGGARAEKTRFFSQNFPKMPKNAFRLFSKNSPAAQKNWSK